jgi:CRISPR type IV-associated DEAD/DEAH-box helicase Csf4
MLPSYLDTTPSLKKASEAYASIVDKLGLTPRVGQKNLIANMIDALLNGKVHLGEGPPSLGKTFAELLAAAFVVWKTGESVKIATPRRDLQVSAAAQYKKMLLPEHFKSASIAVLKGRTNYVSVAKLASLREEKIDENLEYEDAFEKFMEVVGDDRVCGDLDLCREAYKPLEPLGIPLDSLALPLSASSDEDKQYYNAAKEKAAKADILIINHSLLAVLARTNFGAERDALCEALKNDGILFRSSTAADLRKALRESEIFKQIIGHKKNKKLSPELKHLLDDYAEDKSKSNLKKVNMASLEDYYPREFLKEDLPFDFSRIIVDEADMLVGNIRTFLSDRMAFSTVAKQVGLLGEKVGKQKVKFPGQQAIVSATAAAEAHIKSLSREITEAYDAEEIKRSFNLSVAIAGNQHRGLIEKTSKVMEGMHDEIKKVIALAKKHERHLKLKAVNAADSIRDSSIVVADYNHVLKTARGKRAAEGYSGIASPKDELFVISFSPIERYPSFAREKLDVSSWLNNVIWSKVDGCALISGTLADAESFAEDEVKPSFRILKGDTGLNFVHKPFVQEIYPKPFKWDKIEMLIYKDSPICETANGKRVFDQAFRDSYVQFAASRIIEALPTAKGGAMVLCPSYEDVNGLHAALNGNIERALIAQGIKYLSLQSSLDAFLRDPGNSLFLSTGAWQGVDLPGDLLTELFILKIPFLSPESPEFQVRIRQYTNKDGEEKTSGYRSIDNQVFNKFRQGVLRLPRGEHDRGKIHIFDSRILSDGKKYKPYLRFLTESFKNVKIME